MNTEFNPHLHCSTHRKPNHQHSIQLTPSHFFSQETKPSTQYSTHNFTLLVLLTRNQTINTVFNPHSTLLVLLTGNQTINTVFNPHLHTSNFTHRKPNYQHSIQPTNSHFYSQETKLSTQCMYLTDPSPTHHGGKIPKFSKQKNTQTNQNTNLKKTKNQETGEVFNLTLKLSLIWSDSLEFYNHDTIKNDTLSVSVSQLADRKTQDKIIHNT